MNKLIQAGKDSTTWTLLFSNIIVLVSVLGSHLTLGEVLYIFYFQNIIIGFFIVLKIWGHEGDFLGDKEDRDFFKGQKIHTVKTVLSLFFILHFGIFHLVYLIFLGIPSFELLHAISLYCAIFFANHLFSYIYFNVIHRNPVTMEHIFSEPYKRIIPMHFFIIVGPFVIGGIVFIADLFMGLNEASFEAMSNVAGILFIIVLKTIVDITSHVKQHKNDMRLKSNHLYQEK